MEVEHRITQGPRAARLCAQRGRATAGVRAHPIGIPTESVSLSRERAQAHQCAWLRRGKGRFAAHLRTRGGAPARAHHQGGSSAVRGHRRRQAAQDACGGERARRLRRKALRRLLGGWRAHPALARLGPAAVADVAWDHLPRIRSCGRLFVPRSVGADGPRCASDPAPGKPVHVATGTTPPGRIVRALERASAPR